MSKQLNPGEIRIYLQDLYDIRAEHDKSVETCVDCVNLSKSGFNGGCTYISVISVEIVTYERKLNEIA